MFNNVHGRTGNYANIRLYDAGNIFLLNVFDAEI